MFNTVLITREWQPVLAPFVSRYVEIEGSPLHVADYGGAGTPLVCVHGLGGSHINWVAVAGGLARLGHVTALDLPGFGFSPVAGGESTMEAHRRTLDGYLRSLGEPAVLVANSMGAALSILQTAASPDTVRALVLVSPASPRARGVWPDREVTTLFSLYLVPGGALGAVMARRKLMTPEEIARWTLDLCACHADRVAPDVLAAHVEVATRRVQFPGIDRALVRTARSMLRLLARQATFDRAVSAITAPTLLLQGRADRLVRYESALRLEALRPDWDVRFLDDVGHVAMLEIPATFVDLVTGWLEQRMAA